MPAVSLTHCVSWLVRAQGLVAGPFCGQLASLLASLPGEVVEQLQGMMGQLAERIGSHGQQVRLLQPLRVDVACCMRASVHSFRSLSWLPAVTAVSSLPVRRCCC